MVGAFVVTASTAAIMGAVWGLPMKRMLGTRLWPEVDATILETHVYETKAAPPLYGSKHTVTATIKYDVGGVTRTVEQTPVFWNVPAPEATRLRPAQGSVVRVRYNPSDPSEVSFEMWTKEHTKQASLFAVFAIGSLLLAPLVVWKAITRKVR